MITRQQVIVIYQENECASKKADFSWIMWQFLELRFHFFNIYTNNRMGLDFLRQKLDVKLDTDRNVYFTCSSKE
jgi:hypothetical protein